MDVDIDGDRRQKVRVCTSLGTVACQTIRRIPVPKLQNSQDQTLTITLNKPNPDLNPYRPAYSTITSNYSVLTLLAVYRDGEAMWTGITGRGEDGDGDDFCPHAAL